MEYYMNVTWNQCGRSYVRESYLEIEWSCHFFLFILFAHPSGASVAQQDPLAALFSIDVFTLSR